MIDHRNNFNLLRLLAACQVGYMHSVAHLHLPRGEVLFWVLAQFPGVACFFVISGFLVTDSYLRSSGPASFFFKRTLRIYPGLIANILILEFLMWITGGTPGAAHIIEYLRYVPVFILTASDVVSCYLNGIPIPYSFHGFFTSYPSEVLWTLTVELSFYLVLPFFIAMIVRWRTLGSYILLMAMAASAAIVYYPANYHVADSFFVAHPFPEISVAPYLWIFGLGIVARIYWSELARLFEGRVLLWLAGYLAVAAALVHVAGVDMWLDFKYAPGLAGLVRIILLGCAVLAIAFSFRGLTERLRLDRNDLSYGFYLYHMLAVETLVSFGFRGSWWLWPVVFGAGFLMAAGSWFLVEKPALALKNRPRARARPSEPLPTGAVAGVASAPAE